MLQETCQIAGKLREQQSCLVSLDSVPPKLNQARQRGSWGIAGVEGGLMGQGESGVDGLTVNQAGGEMGSGCFGKTPEPPVR